MKRLLLVFQYFTYCLLGKTRYLQQQQKKEEKYKYTINKFTFILILLKNNLLILHLKNRSLAFLYFVFSSNHSGHSSFSFLKDTYFLFYLFLVLSFPKWLMMMLDNND